LFGAEQRPERVARLGPIPNAHADQVSGLSGVVIWGASSSVEGSGDVFVFFLAPTGC
jgi:hypothetical protein